MIEEQEMSGEGTDGSTIRGPKKMKEKALFPPLAASSFFPPSWGKDREGKKRERETTNTVRKGRKREG